jgi:hypothetical protein
MFGSQLKQKFGILIELTALSKRGKTPKSEDGHMTVRDHLRDVANICRNLSGGKWCNRTRKRMKSYDRVTILRSRFECG